MFDRRGVLRPYTKASGKPAAYSLRFTIAAGGTVKHMHWKVLRKLSNKLKNVKVQGASAADGDSVGPIMFWLITITPSCSPDMYSFEKIGRQWVRPGGP